MFRHDWTKQIWMVCGFALLVLGYAGCSGEANKPVAAPTASALAVEKVAKVSLPEIDASKGERPTKPGDYRVSMGNRQFLLHLPPGSPDTGDKKRQVLCLLHGAHEDDPESWGLRKFGMNAHADKDGFICVYPIAQPVYSVLSKEFYAWNSKLGTLAEFREKFEDDAQFLKMIHGWLVQNVSADPEDFSLGGFSEGALMSTIMAQTGELPINWLFSCGGTLLEGQEKRHPQKGPRHVFIQLNMKDDKVLPNNKDGVVVQGTQFGMAQLVGYVNMAKSKPLSQVRYWRQEFLAGGGKEEHSAEEKKGVYRRNTYLVRQADGGVKHATVVDEVVEGEHAWHGHPEGGDPEEGIKPRMDYSLPDTIAELLRKYKAPGK